MLLLDNSTIAKYLTRRTLVELQGRIDVAGYIAKDGTAKGSLLFYVNSIKLHGKSNLNNQTPVVPIETPTMEPSYDTILKPKRALAIADAFLKSFSIF